jgi:ArsR family transcriptional regulator, arsenate/arsenite/antimonite-responsive transcriptional repressor
MGVTKTDNYSADLAKTAAVLKALGHPARLAIVEHLMKVKSCICNDFLEEIPLSQATISQHLKELKQVGIIKGSVEGTSICYCLNPEVLESILQYFNHLNTIVKNQKFNCC